MPIRSILPTIGYEFVYDSNVTVAGSSTITVNVETIPSDKFVSYFVIPLADASTPTTTFSHIPDTSTDINLSLLKQYDSISNQISVSVKITNNTLNNITFRLLVVKLNII